VTRALSFGPLVWESGLEYAIHAVALARARGAVCRLRIVGAGEHLHAVAFARHQLDVVDLVELVAPENASPLAHELRAADVLVDAAVADTPSNAALETARELGVPFVATRRPGLGDDGGLIVERRDPAAIADALARLAVSPRQRA
jgi:glycosyltransferase involved in cell wall biosynthesis